MSAIDAAFARLKSAGEPGLVIYVTAGDPDLGRTEELLSALPSAGADVLEVGVPFSDPLADGPVIQRAYERALRTGTTLARVLDMLRRRRPSIAAPVVLFTYANPIERLGYDAFTAGVAEAGIDGVLVLDLPIDEAGPLSDELRARSIAPIFLVSPTTPIDRVRRAADLGSGFLYAISRLGVTGAREAFATEAGDVIARVREATGMPVALGFGISTPAQVQTACHLADAAVVGSALVNVISEAGPGDDATRRACDFVRWLKGRP